MSGRKSGYKGERLADAEGHRVGESSVCDRPLHFGFPKRGLSGDNSRALVEASTQPPQPFREEVSSTPQPQGIATVEYSEL